ncbi:unnamed protein product [Sphagnum balticum]
MAKSTILTTTALVISLLLEFTIGLQIQVRFIVNPSDVSCVYQQLSNDLTLQYTVMVLSGNDLDIGLRVEVGIESGMAPVAWHAQVRHHADKLETVKYGAGHYSFCFDNSYSTDVKHVSFFLTTGNDYQDPVFQQQARSKELARDELGEELNAKVDAFKQQLDKMYENFENVQTIQRLYNHYELMDRETAEMNFTRVNIWSTVSILMMLIASLVQVYLIKSLFEDKSKIGQVLRKAGSEKKAQY